MKWKRYSFFVALLVVLSVVCPVIIEESAFLSYLEARLTQMQFSVRGQSNHDSVIVMDIDSLSVKRMWSPEQLAGLIDAIVKQRPRAIALNVFLVKSVDPTNTCKLLRSLLSGKVIVADIKERESLRPIWLKNDLPCQPLVAQLETQAGYIDFERISNSAVLAIDPSAKNNRKPFAFVVRDQLAGIDSMPPLYQDNKLIINFAGPTGTFRHLPAQHFLTNIDETIVENKIVVVGLDTGVHEDITPFGMMSFSEIQANVINNVLSNSFLNKNYWIDAFFLIFTCLSTLFVRYRCGAIYGFWMLPICLVSTQLLFSQCHVILPKLGVILVWFVALFLSNARKAHPVGRQSPQGIAPDGNKVNPTDEPK